mmetsp:Transcript_83330/g.222829  ORF Transcript_83330/g.222829 Transcript_83330/m.222829 type:complete len:390 (-) Transcript_83330:20-1189(-)
MENDDGNPLRGHRRQHRDPTWVLGHPRIQRHGVTLIHARPLAGIAERKTTIATVRTNSHMRDPAPDATARAASTERRHGMARGHSSDGVAIEARSLIMGCRHAQAQGGGLPQHHVQNHPTRWVCDGLASPVVHVSVDHFLLLLVHFFRGKHSAAMLPQQQMKPIPRHPDLPLHGLGKVSLARHPPLALGHAQLLPDSHVLVNRKPKLCSQNHLADVPLVRLASALIHIARQIRLQKPNTDDGQHPMDRTSFRVLLPHGFREPLDMAGGLALTLGPHQLFLGDRHRPTLAHHPRDGVPGQLTHLRGAELVGSNPSHAGEGVHGQIIADGEGFFSQPLPRLRDRIVGPTIGCRSHAVSEEVGDPVGQRVGRGIPHLVQCPHSAPTTPPDAL